MHCIKCDSSLIKSPETKTRKRPVESLAAPFGCKIAAGTLLTVVQYFIVFFNSVRKLRIEERLAARELEDEAPKRPDVSLRQKGPDAEHGLHRGAKEKQSDEREATNGKETQRRYATTQIPQQKQSKSAFLVL